MTDTCPEGPRVQRWWTLHFIQWCLCSQRLTPWMDIPSRSASPQASGQPAPMNVVSLGSQMPERTLAVLFCFTGPWWNEKHFMFWVFSKLLGLKYPFFSKLIIEFSFDNINFKKSTTWKLWVKFYLGQNWGLQPRRQHLRYLWETAPKRQGRQFSIDIWFLWRENTCNQALIFPKVFSLVSWGFC